MMAIIRRSIEEHIERNEMGKDNQVGFTEGNRIENNLCILRYCIESSYNMKKPLIVISIDFTKAFDSIKREKLIETLMEYKINPQIIAIIANMYEGDKTKMEVSKEDHITLDVTSGIRQGCTGSTTLFKLATFKVIQRLEELDKGYQDEIFKITSLFYADDGMILTNSLEHASTVVEEVVNVSKNLGLEINKQKSNIIIFNIKEKPEMIGEIKSNR